MTHKDPDKTWDGGTHGDPIEAARTCRVVRGEKCEHLVWVWSDCTGVCSGCGRTEQVRPAAERRENAQIPVVTLPMPFDEIPGALARLRAHRCWIEEQEKATTRLIRAVEEQCPHTNARSWPTGDGDGSVGFQCPHCKTLGERK